MNENLKRAGIAAPLIVIASAFATTSGHAASSYDYGDTYPDYYRSPYLAAPEPTRRVRARPAMPKAEPLPKDLAKPQGPLLLSISIENQTLKMYDSRGLFAETAISSGMKGHPTPYGVFSIIQKNKWHRSNIYSGAPMPYMQRITWSGIALHAGVLPGYPASHGCIRLPTSFASKLWVWTKMGARVVVAPDDVKPIDIMHPALAKLATSPLAALPVEALRRVAQAADPTSSPVLSDAAPETPRAPDAPLAEAVPAPAERTTEPTATADVQNDAKNDATKAASDPATNLPDAAPAAVAETPADPPDAAQTIATETLPPADPITPTVTTTDAPAAVTPELPVVATVGRRDLPVSIFVSRKDRKVYVRQAMVPLFDVPIDLAEGERPFGIHVFTARSSDGDKALIWSSVTLPQIAKRAAEPERVSRKEASSKKTGRHMPPVSSAPALSAAEALDRVQLPSEVMERLGGTLAPGSTVLIADQGIASGETGLGTDFILRLR